MIPRPPRSALFPYTTLFRSAPPSWRVIWLMQDYISGRPAVEVLAWMAARRPRLRIVAASHDVAADVRRALGKGADRKSTRLNSSHTVISYAVFCLKKKMPNK